MILIKILEIMFPPSSEMQYNVSDLSIVASFGEVLVQGPHMDSFSGSKRQNLSFLYSLTPHTSLVFWHDIGGNVLHPTRVNVPPGAVVFFGGNIKHSGPDYHNPTPHFRLHGYIDNVYVNHNYPKMGFANVDTKVYRVVYETLQP